MNDRAAHAPLLGWLGAAGAAAGLLTGAAALAMTALVPPAPLMLDLGREPPTAPALAALAEAAPQVVDEAPDLAAPPVAPAALPAPEQTLPETLAAPAPPLPDRLPPPDTAPRADLALPAPDPTPVVKPAPPDPKPAKVSQPKTKSAKASVAKASAAGVSAPKAASKPAGGATSTSAAYAKAVMKKVRATSKVSGGGKGRVIVGFTVAHSGALAAVTVLRSSGDRALDAVALNHIRRAAPFPEPPQDSGRSFSFEFVAQ
jgi:protein TonB